MDGFGQQLIAQLPFILILIIYFIPTFIARNNKNFLPIFIVNFLTGWTFVGWVVAFAWAIAKD